MKFRTYFAVTCILSVSAFALSGCNGQNRGSAGINSSSTTTPSTTLPSATYSSIAQTMAASTTVKTLTWNLSTQMNGTSPLPGGGTFSIGIQEVNSVAGGPEYYFSNPTVTGGSSAILVQNIGLELNGVMIPGADVFTGVNRMVPASPNSRILLSATDVVPVSAFSTTDTLAITFGQLTPTVFNPPTYTQLKSATGPFGVADSSGQTCISCHSSTNANGGVDLTTYTNLIDVNQAGYFPAVAFDPSDSLIFMRMTNQPVSGTALGYMPPAPAAPMTGTCLNGASCTQNVSDWINDGAPNN